jgi:uncharacterized protein
MDKETRMWAMAIHFSVFAGYVIPMAGLIAPIVIWQVYKDKMPELDGHGRIVANFLISMLIYGVVAVLLSFALIGIPLLIALGIFGTVLPIIGGVKASNGEVWPYPLMLKIF